VRAARHIVIAALMALVVSASAYAQGKPPVKSAQDSYKAGVTAVKSQNWDAAITALKAAIQVDSASRSYRDGTIGDEYWPQFYLFVAYAGKKDFVNASSYNAQKGSPPANVLKDGTIAQAALTQWQNDNRTAQQNAAQFDKLLGDGNTALTAKNYDGAIAAFDNASKLAGIDDAKKKQATDKLTQARNDQRALNEANAANTKKLGDFNTAFGRGNAALGNKQWSDAITAYNSARGAFPEEFQRQNGLGKIDEANRGIAADRQARTDFEAMVQRGNTAYGQKNWAAAIKEYTDAKNKLPNDFASAPGGLPGKLDDATKQKGNIDFFENAVKTAEAAFAAKNYADAKTNYQNAKDRIPAEFANRKLQAKLDTADSEVKKMGAEAARKAEITSMVRTAEGALAAKRFDDAIGGYNSVKSKYPADFQQQNLQAKIDEAMRGKTAAADAKVAADRAAADKLAAAEKAAAEKLAAQQNAADAARLVEQRAHDGLLALFQGDAGKASPLLEQAIDGSAKATAHRRAVLNAYLAVAYAAQSIQKKDKALEDKAREQFKQAQQLQKGYKLEDKLVSPQVKKLLTGTN